MHSTYGGRVYIYFHRAIKYLVEKIQNPVPAVDDNVLWCVREDAMRCTTLFFERRAPSYPCYHQETIITST
jgi:hypothetical protein